MTILLVNFTPEVDDPRVEVYGDYDDAMATVDAMPGRVSFLVEKDDDLLGIASGGPRNADGTPVRLGGAGLAKIFNAFSCEKVSGRFTNRANGATRTAQLLLRKFTEVKKMEQVQEHTVVDDGDDGAPQWEPKAGDRVTLIADPKAGIPEEHGLVIAVAGEMATVEVDPAYRSGPEDDGHRDIELRELAPDPKGVARQKVETVDEKAAARVERERVRAQKAAARLEKVQAAEAAKKAKADARALKAADRDASKAATRKIAASKPVADSNRARVLTVALAEPKTVEEIALAVGIDVPKVRIILRDLRVRHGVIVENMVVTSLPEGKTAEEVLASSVTSSGLPRATGGPRPNELDAAAARGEVPVKPVIASVTNMHRQKHFDRLHELSEAGDWDGVAAYHMNGIDSYSAMINRYRDRLLAAHRAQTQPQAAE
jgi:hypothetical protein